MRYESKISVLPNREVVVVTGEEPRRYEDLPEPELLNPREYRYSSVEELRKSLVRQKFYAEIAFKGNLYSMHIATGGYALALISTMSRQNMLPYFSFSNMAEAGGVSIATSALLLRIKFGDRIIDHKKRVDSRVKAFNETFPDLKPVTFSPRDYLSTLRLPFRR